MKKIFTILALCMIGFTFISCEKEAEEIEDTSKSYAVKCYYCGSRNISIFSPPPSHSHLPRTYNCHDCGNGGAFPF